MANPITWQNVLGPSLSEASRPLDSAQRTFSGMFDNLGALLKGAEVQAEEGRTILKNDNRNLFLDRLARVRSPEEMAALQQSGELDRLKASFGKMIDPNAIRGADENRLVALRTNSKQGIEFDNLMKDERSMPHMQAFKTAATRGDKLGMAAAEAAYAQAGGRNLSDLVQYADSRDWLGKERVEKQAGWGRDQAKHVDDLATSSVQRTTALGNLAVNQGQLGVSQSQLGIAQSNLGLSEQRLALERIKAQEGSEDRLIGQQSDILKNLAGTGRTSLTSTAGAEAATAALKGLPEDAQELGRMYLQKAIAGGVPTGEAIATIGSMRASIFSGDSGDAEKYFRQSVERSMKGNIEGKTNTFLQDQYTTQLKENKQRVQQLENTYAIATGGKPAPQVVVKPDGGGAMIVTNPVKEAEDRPVQQSAASKGWTTPPAMTATQRFEAANAAWKASPQRIGASPEMTELRAARRALKAEEAAKIDMREEADAQIGKQTETTQRLATIERRYTALRNEAAKFVEKGKAVPTNVARGLARDEADLKVLKARLGIQ